MYGVESCVHPEYRGFGIGSKLMDARFDVLRHLNLRGMIAGSLIIDYGKVADTVPVEDYVRDVAAGTRFDTNLSKQLHKGFRVHNLIPNYDPNPNTRDWAVAILWENPDYAADKAASGKIIPVRFDVALKQRRTADSPLGAVGS